MKKIAVTGTLSSGKTTVCQFFKELGAYVIDADEIVHRLLSSDSEIREKIVHALGEEVVVNGCLHREALAKKVFAHPDRLQFIENLLHPLVQNEIKAQYEAVRKDPKYIFFVAEVPLLYEAGMETFFDFTIVVMAKEPLCLERFTAKKGTDSAFFAERMARQLPAQHKAHRADFVIKNSKSVTDLKNEVTKITHQLYPIRKEISDP